MRIRKTTKQHWQNGHQVRGIDFHTLNFSLFNYGVMISGSKLKNINIKLYHLIKDYRCKTVQDCFDDDTQGILN